MVLPWQPKINFWASIKKHQTGVNKIVQNNTQQKDSIIIIKKNSRKTAVTAILV